MATEPIQRAESDEISAKELILNIQVWLKYLLVNWRILLIAGVVGGAIGLAYAFWKDPMYTATTTFVLESSESKGRLGRLAGVASVMGINLGSGAGGLFESDNILELYRSRTMLAQTLLTDVHPDSNELLIERFITYNKVREDWKDKPELLALDFRQDSSTFDPLTRRLYEGVITAFVNIIRKDVLTVEKMDKSNSIIQVDVTSPDEVFAKSFNENLVRQVNEFYRRTKTKRSADNIVILEKKVDSVRAVMTGAIYSAARASDATPNLNPTRQVQRIAPTQEAQFSAEANKTMLAQLLQNLEVTKMNLLQEQPLIQLVDQPVYPLNVDRMGKVKGIIIGGFLFGFLTVLVLIASKYYRDIMDDGEVVVK